MSKGLKITLIIILVIVLVLFIGINYLAYTQAKDLLEHDLQERIDKGEWPPKQTPEDFGREYQDVTTTSPDGLKLTGWYLPGENGATVMIQHGSPGGRQDGLYEAALLNEAGFNVLLGSFRAHDDCEGDIITFGYYEIQDLEAWHDYLKGRDDVDPDRIGLFGESMGGGTSILYAAGDPGVKAVATGSAFGLTQEVVVLFIIYELKPPEPLHPLVPVIARFIVFWAEQIGDMDSQALDTEAVIAEISPVPVMIIHGGMDDKIGPNIGRQLYESAAEPKQLVWFEEAGHVNFEEYYPQEYRKALLDFFGEHLVE